MATETLVIEAEAAKAFRVMDAYYRKQLQVGDATEKMGRKHKEAGVHVDHMDAYLGRAVKGVLAFGGSMLSISAGLDVLRQYEERLSNIASKSNEIAGSAAGFIAMRGPAEAKRIALEGAKYGIKPEESLPLAEIIYGAAGGDEAKAQAMFKTAADLKRLGVTQEGIQAVIKLSGDTRIGMNPEQVAALVFKAGEASQATTADLASVAGGIGQYSNPVMGASFLTSMSGIAEFTKEGIGQLAVYLEKAKLGLATKSDFRDSMKSYAKKQGKDWESLDEIQQLELVKSRLDEKGLAPTIVSFEKLGLTEERQARALSGVVGRIDDIKRAYGDLQKVPADLVSGLVDAQMQVPMMKAAFLKAQSDAAKDVLSTYGEAGDLARNISTRSGARETWLKAQHPILAEMIPPFLYKGGFLSVLGRSVDLAAGFEKYNKAEKLSRLGGLMGLGVAGGTGLFDAINFLVNHLIDYPKGAQQNDFSVEMKSQNEILERQSQTLSEIKEAVVQTSINTGTSYEEVSVPGRNAGVE